VHRPIEKPNTVTLIIRIDELERAQKFLRSDAPREQRARDGAPGEPEGWTVQDVYIEAATPHARP
jgi:hypothetical protein